MMRVKIDHKYTESMDDFNALKLFAESSASHETMLINSETGEVRGINGQLMKYYNIYYQTKDHPWIERMVVSALTKEQAINDFKTGMKVVGVAIKNVEVY